MFINGKPIELIDEADVLRHQEDAIQEGRMVDYKVQLPKKGDDKAMIDFCADLASFANAAGGYMIYGADEAQGLPVAFPGLPGVNFDQEILRLDSAARARINPRIPTPQFKSVLMSNGESVLIVGVERSWRLPHMVEGRIYGRGANGKYSMDMAEVSAAVISSAGLRSGLENWRSERIARITGQQGALPLLEGGKLILHLVPLSSLDPTKQVDLHKIPNRPDLLYLFNIAGFITFNFDGLLNRGETRDPKPSTGYVQLFRNGRVEVVDADVMNSFPGRQPGLASIAYEQDLIEAIKRAKLVYVELGIEWPVLVMVSLVEARGENLLVSPRHARSIRPFDREVLAYPEVVWENPDQNIHHLLRPVFDMVWNSVGLPKSMNYDEEGNWVGKQ